VRRTTFESGYDAVLAVQACRDRLNTAISQLGAFVGLVPSESS